MMNWSVRAQGGSEVTVSVPNKESMLIEIAQLFQSRKGFTIATLNLDHVVKLKRDAEFSAAYSAHSHVTADGNPIVWLSRLAGQTDVSLVPGSELVEPVAELASKNGVKVALFGATDESLMAAADAMVAKFVGLDVALTLAPPMGFDPKGAEADNAIAAIKESGARLVFLALGAPKQEVFAARAQAHLPDVGFLSIGAGLDFISGAQKRAPQWVRSLALEWLWRLLGSPKRLAARYGACILMLPRLLVRAMSSRMAAKS